MGEVLRLPDSDPDGRRSMGVTLYLIASALMFGGLLMLFAMLRGQAKAWPPLGAGALPRLLPALATALAVSITLTLRRASRDIVAARLVHLRGRLSAAIIQGAIFAAVGTTLWISMAIGGYRANDPLGGLLYLLLSVYGIHVLGGLSLLSWIRRGVIAGRYHARNSIHLRLVARLWYFLSACWLALYLLLFVI